MAANLSQLFVGLFNAATGGYANQYTTSQANALASVVSIVAGQDLSSDTAFINYALSNLGVPASGATHDAAFAAVQGLVNTQGRGNAVLAAADYLANVAAKDATNQYYSIAQAFVAKVAVADSYTSTHPSTVSVTQLVAGANGGGGLVFTTGNDTITLTGSSNTVTAVVDGVTSSKNTYGSSDLLVGGTTDTLNVTANDDVTTTATVKGLGTVNFKLNALTTPAATATVFNVAATNVDKGTTLTFDNAATVTAIDTVTITGDKGGVRTVSASFPNINDDTTADATFNVNAAGTAASPATLTLGAAAGNVTVNAAGNITYVATTATGLLQLNAAGVADVSSAAAVAAIVNATGNITVTHLDAAKTATLTSTAGKITAGTGTLAAATKVNATSAKIASLYTTAATDVTVSATGNSTTPSVINNDGQNTIKSVTLSGNGGALYADMSSGGTALVSLATTGTQNVTAKLTAANLTHLTTVTKGTTGTFGIDLVGTGSVDLSTVLLDSLNVKANIGSGGASTLTVANGQAVKYSYATAALGATNAVTLSGKASTDTASLALDDGKADGNVVDVTALVIDKIGTLTIDASLDKTASGGAQPSTITSLTEASGASTNVTINTGANGITLTTVTLTGGNTLTINGSGAINAVSAGSLTAGTIDASSVTGVVTLGGTTDLDLTKVTTVKTGAGKDVVSVGADGASSAATFTLNTGAGDDTINLNGDLKTKNVVIDAGEGDDTLVFAAGTDLNAASGKTISLSGVETISYDTTASIDANLLSGATYLLKDAGTGSTVTVKLSASKTTVADLSSLTTTLADSTGVAASTFVADAHTSTVLTSYKGVDIAKNTITGSNNVAATYVGGSKADAFVVGTGLGTFTGGAGKDTYDLAAATGASATKFVTITDLALNDTSAAAVDSIDFGTTGGALITTTTDGWTQVGTSNVLTKAGGTLAGFVTAVQAAEAGGADKDAYVAAIGSDLYIYSTGADKTVLTDDILVKLTGIAHLGIDVVDGATPAGAVAITI